MEKRNKVKATLVGLISFKEAPKFSFYKEGVLVGFSGTWANLRAISDDNVKSEYPQSKGGNVDWGEREDKCANFFTQRWEMSQKSGWLFLIEVNARYGSFCNILNITEVHIWGDLTPEETEELYCSYLDNYLSLAGSTRAAYKAYPRGSADETFSYFEKYLEIIEGTVYVEGEEMKIVAPNTDNRCLLFSIEGSGRNMKEELFLFLSKAQGESLLPVDLCRKSQQQRLRRINRGV